MAPRRGSQEQSHWDMCVGEGGVTDLLAGTPRAQCGLSSCGPSFPPRRVLEGGVTPSASGWGGGGGVAGRARDAGGEAAVSVVLLPSLPSHGVRVALRLCVPLPVARHPLLDSGTSASLLKRRTVTAPQSPRSWATPHPWGQRRFGNSFCPSGLSEQDPFRGHGAGKAALSCSSTAGLSGGRRPCLRGAGPSAFRGRGVRVASFRFAAGVWKLVTVTVAQR